MPELLKISLQEKVRPGPDFVGAPSGARSPFQLKIITKDWTFLLFRSGLRSWLGTTQRI